VKRSSGTTFPGDILGPERRLGLIERRRVPVVLTVAEREPHAATLVGGVHPVDAADLPLVVEYAEVVLPVAALRVTSWDEQSGPFG
jgi:hypothetical protein